MYSFYSFMTSAVDGSELSVSFFGWVGPRAGLWTQRIEENSFASAGD
jgi:hypothetical protein